MANQLHGGILRSAFRIARTNLRNLGVAWCWISLFSASILSMPQSASHAIELDSQSSDPVTRYHWKFGRTDDTDNDGWPDGWQRYVGPGYPKYVSVEIKPHNDSAESLYRTLDANILKAWVLLRRSYPGLPLLPPSVADAAEDRYLHVQLDGGQLRTESPPKPASRIYKYRFSCRLMTRGLRHDTARAEVVCVDGNGQELEAFSTPPMSGTNDWTEMTLDVPQPPYDTKQILIRLLVQRSESGVEDIRGAIGFDDITLEQYPQIKIVTDQKSGIYQYGRPIISTAKVLGLQSGVSRVRFELTDHQGRAIAERLIQSRQPQQRVQRSQSVETVIDEFDSVATWKLPRLDPGFYRVSAALVDRDLSTLATETTIAVIDRLTDEPLGGPFGWTLPNGLPEMEAREAANWLASLGVAWIKYPCWKHPDDLEGIDQLASTLTKLQDAGIETVGMLDQPPKNQVPLYGVRGRRDLVAAQLFSDFNTWQPLLEPVMSRLNLSVRMWQLGKDRDDSFLGSPRLKELIEGISAGLQGFGEPTDVAISWPWLEARLPAAETSWQAVCRSSQPNLAASELDALLTQQEADQQIGQPRTWLLLDPIDQENYPQSSRVNDLVMRMATVRRHQVEAAFVSNPFDPKQGLLRPDGRPSELLLPWRTTARLLGNLRGVGSLQLRSGAENIVFAGADRVVLMVWSPLPVEELIYLGENVTQVDVWGKSIALTPENVGNQTAQRFEIGKTPTFIIGADPELLAFRMSVVVSPKQLDSFLGRNQQLTVEFTNPTNENLVGTLRVLNPQSWHVEDPTREWEALARKTTRNDFTVVLSNAAKVGTYEVPFQFALDTVPPKILTTYRKVHVGPKGLDIDVVTHLLANNDLQVKVELTNRSDLQQSYDLMMFATPDRQYQRQFITVQPGETSIRFFTWGKGDQLLGEPMLLRADEQDGPRMLNYPFTVSR